MHLRLQATPGNLNAQIKLLQHRLNKYGKIMGSYAPNLAFWGIASLGLFQTLAWVLIQLNLI